MSIPNGLLLSAMSVYLITTVAVCPFSCRSSGEPPPPSDTGTVSGDVAGDVGDANEAGDGTDAFRE